MMPRALALMAAGILACSAPARAAETYPQKPIRLIVPFAPGGGADIMGRAIGQRVSSTLKQSVVIENRPGAAGRLGAELVAKSAPDGYTLFLGTTSTLVWGPNLYDKLAYDATRDFAPVAPFASAITVLVVHPSIPARTVRELIALATARPGQLNYASSGAGAPAHLAAELFNYAARVKTNHIPYKGSAPGTIALISGETDLMFSNILPALSPLKAGKMRALAVTSLKRASVLPDVPTVAESGLKDFEVYVFYGVVGPAGMASDVTQRLHAEIAGAVQTAAVRERLLADGAEPMSSASPGEFGQLIAREYAKWARVIKQAGLKGD